MSAAKSKWRSSEISIKSAKSYIETNYNDVTVKNGRKPFGDHPRLKFLVKCAKSLTAFASYLARFIRNPKKGGFPGFRGSFDCDINAGLTLTAAHIKYSLLEAIVKS